MIDWEKLSELNSKSDQAPWEADIDDDWCWTGKFYIAPRKSGGQSWCFYDDPDPEHNKVNFDLHMANINLIAEMRNNLPEILAFELKERDKAFIARMKKIMMNQEEVMGTAVCHISPIQLQKLITLAERGSE